MKNKKLDGTALGLAAGLLWGFGVFFLTWWVMLFDGVTHDVTFLGHLYRGYNISPTGSFIGLLWALADGAIGGMLFARLYNRFAARRDRLAVLQAKVHDRTPTVTH